MDKAVLEAIKNAAHKATFEELYMHEVRHSSGVVDWDLSTCESDDLDADGDSIARIYDRRNISYFIEMTPERAIALVNEVERLTANYDALVTAGLQSAAKYEQLIADLQAERDALEAEASVYRVTVLGVNVAAGQGED